MKSLLIFLLSIATAFSVAKRPLIHQSRQMRSGNYHEEVVKASNTMGFSLLQELPQAGNIIISPLSISMAMGMVYLGARNRTAAEMERVLGYKSAKLQPENVPVGHKQTLDILKQGTDSSGQDRSYTLEIASAMLIEKDFETVSAFKEIGRFFYDAAVETVSFGSDAESTLQSINGWTAWKTRNKITQMLQEPLDPLTKLFLMNAVYFKGTWKTKFNQRLTMPDTFYNDGKVPTTVPMMRQKEKFKYSFVSQLDSSALELPYEGDHITMLILLPERRDGLRKMESSLTREILDNVTRHLREVKVQVTLPRFTLNEESDMIAIFKAMGLRSLFNADQADLSGLSPKKGLYVTKIVHKSVIDVTEEGSEAASVTGVSAGVRTGSPLHPIFTADHPFMFFIRDRRTDAILFIGRVNTL